MSSHEPCPRTETLSALVDDALQAGERAEIEAHVARCALCAPVLADLRQLRTRFAALPAVTPDFDIAAEVDRRIDAASAPAPRRTPSRTRPHWWQVALLAPGGAVAISLGVWLGIAAMPAALSSARAPAAQMAAFSPLPPGALCPALRGCGGPAR